MLDKDPNLVNAVDAQRSSVIFKTISYGNLPAFHRLIREDKNILLSQYQSHPNFLLLTSVIVRCGSVEMLETVFEHFPETLLEIDPNNGLTALQLACRINKMEMIKVIVEKGVEKSGINFVAPKMPGKDFQYFDEQNRYNSTAVHYAISQESEEMLSLLIDNGADLSITNRGGQTPLAYACSQNQQPMVEYLLSQQYQFLVIN